MNVTVNQSKHTKSRNPNFKFVSSLLQTSNFKISSFHQTSTFEFQVYPKLQILPSNLNFAVQTRNLKVQTRKLQVQTRNFVDQTRNLLFETRNFDPRIEIWRSISSMYWFKIDNPGLLLGGKFQVLRVNFKFGDTNDIPNFKFEVNSKFEIWSLT